MAAGDGAETVEMMGLRAGLSRLHHLIQRGLAQSPPGLRRGAAMVVDAVIVLESFALALLFRFNGDVPQEFWSSFWPFVALGAILFVALLYESRVYSSVLRYTGIYQGVRIASATAVATGALLIIDLVAGEFVTPLRPMPLSVVLIGAVLAYVQLVAVRLYPRVFYELSLREIDSPGQAIIVGTGESGVGLERQIERRPEMRLRVVGFASDSPEDLDKNIEGTPVVGMVEDLGEIIQNYRVDEVIVALPRAGTETMNRIWEVCSENSVKVRVMPSLSEFLEQGSPQLRDLQIEDLLGRDPVDIDLGLLKASVSGRRVLVTGAGGSIGSELCRQIRGFAPESLLLVDRDENALYYLSRELEQGGISGVRAVVADITSPEHIRSLCEEFLPHLVFHAAAYKHVPLMEAHPDGAIANNIGGTVAVARAAGECGAEKFVNVSTDKAVNPASIMGATKRLSEMGVRALSDRYPRTVYSSVRFGNVLDSQGSVVPTFRRQIEAGGPVTVTHPEMTRYFMTIPEAVSLILQAGAMSEQRATYVLEMGHPVSILDLAQKMIGMMGATGVGVQFTGLRAGEKLEEELFEDNESRTATDHPMVFAVKVNGKPDEEFMGSLEEMVGYARDHRTKQALELLRLLSPGYVGAPEK